METAEGRPNVERWTAYRREVKKISLIAVPMVVVAALQYLMQMAAVVMVGHVDQLSLSSLAIATSLTNVTGFSLLSGLVGGLETLCGQAYGAKQHNKIGVYTCSAIISLLLVSIPISVSWIFLDKFLILIHQDPQISHEARKYSLYLIPALFFGAIVKPLVRSLQSQSLTLPLLVSAALVLCFHVPLCWVLVFKLKMGGPGAAVAFSVSNLFYLILIVFYVRFSSTCENTRVTFSMDAVRGIKEFFRFAVPSAVMICLKWWSLEVLVLLSGVLPNPTLETSVLSICLTISTLHFTIPYGFGAAASTRVSNELGAGNPQAARLAVHTVMILMAMEAIIVSATVFGCRNYIGKIFSSEKEVVSYITSMSPFLSLSIITDSLQAAISGQNREGKWVATYRSLCESGGILSVWDSSGYCSWVPCTFESEGTLDWDRDWINNTVHVSVIDYWTHGLAKTGDEGEGADFESGVVGRGGYTELRLSVHRKACGFTQNPRHDNKNQKSPKQQQQGLGETAATTDESSRGKMDKNTPPTATTEQERVGQQQQHSRTSKHPRQGQNGQKQPPRMSSKNRKEPNNSSNTAGPPSTQDRGRKAKNYLQRQHQPPPHQDSLGLCGDFAAAVIQKMGADDQACHALFPESFYKAAAGPVLFLLPREVSEYQELANFTPLRDYAAVLGIFDSVVSGVQLGRSCREGLLGHLDAVLCKRENMEMGDMLPDRKQWGDYGREVQKVTVIAVPMVVVALLPYLMQMVAVVMVGHVDELSLSSLAIATSFTNVTGFSLLSGLVGGLETLCGQAFGAKQQNKMGVYILSAIISLLLISIPISISWIFLDKFLISIGHDPLISHEARKYALYLIPSLFSGAMVKPLVRLLQSQSLTLPLLVTSTLVLCFHVPLCWGFIFKLNMGGVGAATAFSLSNWFYVMLMVFYFKFSSLCKNVGVSFSMDALLGVKEFLWFAVPSAVMVW
ncbi:hypothetical protein LXL04_024488 [Taraxacum kok-saghyz]